VRVPISSETVLAQAPIRERPKWGLFVLTAVSDLRFDGIVRFVLPVLFQGFKAFRRVPDSRVHGE
jgi:hypothetical protein